VFAGRNLRELTEYQPTRIVRLDVMLSVLDLQRYCALLAASSLRVRANGANDTLPGHLFEGICQKGYSVCYGLWKAVAMTLPGPFRRSRPCNIMSEIGG
jgi:hypothetical protein